MTARPAGLCHIVAGDIEVTFLPDGFIRSTPASSYPNSPAALWQASPHLLDEDGLLVMSLGALLVRTPTHNVLIDLGWGPDQTKLVNPATGVTTGQIMGGALLESLATQGISPDEIDAVLFSHLHRDHLGWIVTERGAHHEDHPQLTFANATHLCANEEWTYWSAEGRAGLGPAPTRGQLDALATRISFVADGNQPLPGIDVVATPGHTPGHLSFVLSSGGDRVVVLGDAVHCPIEIQEPELAFVVDVDPALASRTRAFLERELTRPSTVAAGAHFADLVFGRLIPGKAQPTWHFSKTQALT